MSPPHRQSVTVIVQELGIHVITLYKLSKAWRLQGGGGADQREEPRGYGEPSSAPTTGFKSTLRSHSQPCQ